jgi:hypothetical protein
MSTNYSPKIVTSGLVLYLDAGNSKSYVSGSTVWRDLSGNKYSGSLFNGPTFNSANGGSIAFDGVDDYVLTNYSDNPSDITFELIVKPLNISTGSIKAFLAKYDGSTFFYIGLQSSDSSIYREGNGGFIDSNVIPPNTSSFYSITVINSGGSRAIYINGDLKNGSAVTVVPANVGGGLYIGTLFPGSTILGAFALYSLKVYERMLSASEILQNYNATKKRFGL